ncbi:MAG: GntR family transcriptional regulator [Dermatophilus congolensis]|nr:GntR family transcriptional regulator [Dermatophilus congolensis]
MQTASEVLADSSPDGTENKAQRVYRMLREAIIAGEYSPGYRLVLSRLAEDFAVSPVPVREAVRRLEAQGLVSYTRNVGFEVTGVDQNDYADAMQTLAYLEGAATSLAAPLITAAQLDEAQELNDQMRTIGRSPDPVQFTELNGRFHVLLCSQCPNLHLLELVKREWGNLSRIRRSTFTYIPDRAAQSVVEHENLINMLRRGDDPAEIEMAFRNHTLRTMNIFLERRNARESSGS